MQKLYFVIFLAIIIVVAVFAFTNDGGVTVSLLGVKEINTNVAMLILVCFAAGAAMMAILDLIRGVRTWKDIKSLRKKLHESEELRALLEAQVKQLSGKKFMDEQD